MKKSTKVLEVQEDNKLEEPKMNAGGLPESEEILTTTQDFRAQLEKNKQLKLQKEAKRNMQKSVLKLQSKVLYEWIDRELRRIPQDRIKIIHIPTKELDFKQEEYPYTNGIDKLIKRFMKGYDAFTYEHLDTKTGNAKWMSRFEIKHSEDGSVVLVSIWKW